MNRAGSVAATNDVDDEHRMGIVLVNYASTAVIERNLGRIDLGSVPCRVVVVDNFSTEKEAAAAAVMAVHHGWDLVRMAENAGFGSAVNVGVARAGELGCECFLILNPDASTSAAVIEELRRASLADRRALITPIIERPDGSVWFQGRRIGVRWGGLSSPDMQATQQGRAWLTAACLAVHREMWEALGGFDDDYFLYWEDVDLSYRCQRLGGRLTIRTDLRAVHEVGGTQEPTRGTAGKSAAYNYYNCRNRLLFAGKHLRWAHRLIWLAQTPIDTVRVLRRGGRGEIFNLHRVLLPGLCGVASGVRWIVGHQPVRAEPLPEATVRSI